MRNLACLLCLLLIGSMLQAQSSYTEALAQGKAALRQQNYLKALRKYFAAEAFDPSKKQEVQAEIQVVFQKIEKLRKEAEAQAKEAKEQAKAAKMALRREKEQRDRAQKIAQEKLEEIQRNFQSIVRLFSSKTKEVQKMQRKRQFFGSAFRLSRDSLLDVKSFDKELIEAAAQCVEPERKHSDLQRSFEYCHINDLLLLPSGDCYAVGGLGRSFRYHFDWNDTAAVLAPKMQIRYSDALAGDSKINALTPLESEKGTFVASAGESGKIYFHHPEYAKLQAVLHGGARVFDLATTANQSLLSVGEDSSLVHYDWQKQKIIERIQLPWLPYRVQSIYREAAAPALLVGGPEGLLFRQDGKEVSLEGALQDFSWSEADSLLFVVRPNQRLDIYELSQEGFELRDSKKLLKHFSTLSLQDGYLFIGYQDGDLEIWPTTNITNFAAEAISLQQEEPIEAIAYFAPLKVVITAGKGYMRFQSLDAVAIYAYLEKRYGQEALSLTPSFYEQFIKK